MPVDYRELLRKRREAGLAAGEDEKVVQALCTLRRGFGKAQCIGEGDDFEIRGTRRTCFLGFCISSILNGLSNLPIGFKVLQHFEGKSMNFQLSRVIRRTLHTRSPNGVAKPKRIYMDSRKT